MTERLFFANYSDYTGTGALGAEIDSADCAGDSSNDPLVANQDFAIVLNNEFKCTGQFYRLISGSISNYPPYRFYAYGSSTLYWEDEEGAGSYGYAMTRGFAN